ncbi:GIY-YIG nuclease family protein [Candidatus Peribacteria bacterium]|jgi:putative endonuclease|nr:GIY-YIG nuclease family protein [Candidatus Peribacteria bacterium]MBT4021510.1 GIY-YIG nuclease family protein [Candidatus Peribacteria bacterium]MBT4240988.1 GIY-YIG nuclease family protein [Candidatus Peribacteria bacterium]MBT4473981.1 GIY-YIG nuclease family protein [Candidatus Peribacteria bacterium]
MWYVYVLRSNKDKNLYIGFTNDLKRRIKEHQSGKNISTAKRLSVILETYIAVTTKKQAMELEKYFKTGSGSTILKKRIIGES